MYKPKILFDASPMMDIRRTGVGYYVDHLFSSLSEHYGNQLDLTGYYFDFLGRGHKKSPKLQNTNFQKIWLVPGKLLSLCRRLGFQPFIEIFTQKSADIVIFTNYVSLPMIRHKPTALIIYDLSFLDHPEYMQPVNLAYLKRFCSPSIRKADLIITISEFTKQRLLYHFPGITPNIIITPIPPAKKNTVHAPIPKRLASLGVEAGKYLLFVSTIEPRKNIQNLVKAYAALPAALRNQYPLVLAGGKGWKDGDILTEIAQGQDKGLHIIQTGYISSDEKHSLYSNATVFVMPSHYEGFGMPILEAMQYGLPVACSDIPVFHEVADNAALYFDKDKPQTIANSLKKILTDRNIHQQLSSAARLQVNKFSWEANAETVYKAFVSLQKGGN